MARKPGRKQEDKSMQFVEAFDRLGYEVPNPRQAWTAEKEDGVCITIWRKELMHEDGRPYLDLWKMYPEGNEWWEDKSEHKRRTRRLERAIDEFGGRVDAILLSGEVGKSYGNADPWDVRKRSGHWRIARLCRQTGYFRAEICPASAPCQANKQAGDSPDGHPS